MKLLFPRLLRLALGCLPFLLPATAPAQTFHTKVSPPEDVTTVFTGARLIDGTGKPPLENAVLIIHGDRIVEVGPAAAKTKALASAKTVDLRGKTIIPGLLSAHSHLGAVKGAAAAAPENYTRENVAAQVAQYETYGVLGIMSLGLNRDILYQWRDEQRQGKLPGADIFIGDRGIGVTRGAPPFPLGPDQVYRPATAEEARAAVRETAARHPDMIKMWVDDLFGGSPKMPPDVYTAVLDEAHKNKLRVAAHVFYLADAKALVSAGLDVIGHSVRDQPVDQELVDMMKAKNVPYIPTLALDEAQFIYAEHPAWMEDPFFIKAVDPGLLATWKGPEYAQKMQANPNTPKNKAALATAQKNVKKLHEAGVTVALGTDSGGLPTRLPGWGEHRELQLWVEAGLKPMDALVCATRNAAQVLGVDQDRGTLEEGKRADFVVLGANPLDDIRNTQKIEAVWHAGNPAVMVIKGEGSPSAPR